MGNVTFEENNNEFNDKTRNLLGQSSDRSMSGWLVRTGIVKSNAAAQIVLIVVAVVLFATAFFVYQSRVNPTNVYITGENGSKYTPEEYINLTKQGIDPLK